MTAIVRKHHAVAGYFSWPDDVRCDLTSGQRALYEAAGVGGSVLVAPEERTVEV